jgi:hypothetical protein
LKRAIVPFLFAATVMGSVTGSSSALADPEVRDHRAPGIQPSVESTPRYRRRPGPRFMLPLKIDLGATGADTSRGFASGVAAAIGIHWASLSPRPTNTDVGIGVFGALLGAPADTTKMNDSNGVAYGGAYLEVGHTLARGSFWRTWAAGRGEYLAASAFGEDHKGFGGAGRLSAELYVSGVGIAPRGVFLGTYAIGAYLEAGVRDVATDVGIFHVSGGLTFRTPLVFSP